MGAWQGRFERSKASAISDLGVVGRRCHGSRSIATANNNSMHALKHQKHQQGVVAP